MSGKTGGGEKLSTRLEKWMDGRSQFGPPITTTQSSQFIIPCPSHSSIPFIGYFYLRAYTFVLRSVASPIVLPFFFFFLLHFASSTRRTVHDDDSPTGNDPRN